MTRKIAAVCNSRFGLLAAVLVLCAVPVRAQTAVTPEPQVDVTGITISGNTLLDSTALAGLLGRYKGRRTLSELKDAAQAVQQAYVDAGYGAVVAYLPPQPVTDGTVTIAVVEGKVSKVTVKGNKRESEAHVRAALPTLVEGSTPRVRRIDSELQIANENPARTVGVLLGPGAASGQVEATVNVEESSQHRFNVALDDTGSDRTGKYRLSAGYQNADLSGNDDVLSVQLQTSPSHPSRVKVVSSGYRMPLPRLLSAIDLFAAYSDIDGGTSTLAGTPGTSLSFSGSGRIAGGRWVAFLPRLGEFDQRLTGGLEYRDYRNQCALTIGSSPADCGGTGANATNAGASVTVTPLSIEYSAQKGGTLNAGLTATLAHNVALAGPHGDRSDFTNVRAGADRDYTVLRSGLSIGYTLPFLEDWQVNGRINGQWTQDRLIPGEQFGLGGANSLRGYDEREIATDRGLVVNAEIWTPKLPTGLGLDPSQTDFRLLAFVDAGQGRNRDHAPCAGDARTRCSLAGAGVGARFVWRTLQARLYVANALKDGATTDKNDWRTHVALYASF